METNFILNNGLSQAQSIDKKELSPMLPEISQPNPMECIEYLNTLSQSLSSFIRTAGSNISYQDCTRQANKLNDTLQWFTRARESLPRQSLTIAEQKSRINNLKNQINDKSKFFNNLIGKPTLPIQALSATGQKKTAKENWIHRAVLSAAHKRKLERAQRKPMKGEQISDNDDVISDPEFKPMDVDINKPTSSTAINNANESSLPAVELPSKILLTSNKNASNTSKYSDNTVSVSNLLQNEKVDDVIRSIDLEIEGDICRYKAHSSNVPKTRDILNETAKKWNYYRPKLELNVAPDETDDTNDEEEINHISTDMDKVNLKNMPSKNDKTSKEKDTNRQINTKNTVQNVKGVPLSTAEQRTKVRKYTPDELYPEISTVLKELDII